MNGYIIFIRERTLDEQQLHIYKDQLDYLPRELGMQEFSLLTGPTTNSKGSKPKG